ncbi:glycosyltransferase family 4 protein [Flavisolibacter sp. BT320]|nr:glycosyltransferase family 4 protein [Flavisolibacter longurius]
MPNRILFLTLKVFSATGGIEKVSRMAGKALYDEAGEKGAALRVFSLHDRDGEVQEKYFPAPVFRGFGGRRVAFVLRSIREGRGAALVLLSHVNLLSVGYAIKKTSPGTKLVLLGHGIEVWDPVPAWKRRMLRSCDQVLPVSEFTSRKMQELYGLEEEKMRVLNNGLDPHLPPPVAKGSVRLREKYGLATDARVLLTLTRLSEKDWYKGYDDVIMALRSLKKGGPSLRYLLLGKYDEDEKARLDRLIAQQGLQGEVIFTGFVPDEELAEHFSIADIYVMPSRKEGFGIVFIEALYYGLPVIAGRVDGSVDALDGGKLGALVNPDDPGEIREALRLALRKGKAAVPGLETVLGRFGFPVYKRALWKAIEPFLQPGEKKKQVPWTRRQELVEKVVEKNGF